MLVIWIQPIWYFEVFVIQNGVFAIWDGIFDVFRLCI